MKNLLLFGLLILPLVSIADTPAPGTVKAKTYSGDGLTAIGAVSDALKVQVVNSSGLSTVNQGTAGIDPWFVSVRDSALPTNACKETGGNLAAILSALQSPLAVTGTFWQATQPVSGSLTVSGTVAGTGTFLVDGSAHTQPVSGTFWQTTQPVSGTVTANAGTNLNTSLLALESGGHLASMDLKMPALGQALAAASTPVVLTAAQLSTLTPLSTVTVNAGTGTFLVDGSAHTQPVSGTFWQMTQPVSGTVTADAGSGTFTVDASGHTVPVSGTFWQATQPVSGTVTANLGTVAGLALDTTVAGLQVSQGSTTSGQKGGLGLGAVSTSAPSYTTAQTSPFSLTTAGALRIDGSGTTQPVSGTVTANAGTGTFAVSGTFWQATQPVSLLTLPALTAGSAIIGKVGIDQSTPGTTNGVQVNAALPAGSNTIGAVTQASGPWSTNQTQVGGSSVTLGQKTMANSYPVTTASDQVAPKTYANSAGSFVLNSSLTTVITESVPATAVGFILEAKDSNAANIRWAIGATATTTSGMQLQPGRDTGYVPVGANISVVAESGTLEYQLTWIKQ